MGCPAYACESERPNAAAGTAVNPATPLQAILASCRQTPVRSFWRHFCLKTSVSLNAHAAAVPLRASPKGVWPIPKPSDRL